MGFGSRESRGDGDYADADTAAEFKNALRGEAGIAGVKMLEHRLAATIVHETAVAPKHIDGATAIHDGALADAAIVHLVTARHEMDVAAGNRLGLDEARLETQRTQSGCGGGARLQLIALAGHAVSYGIPQQF